MAGRSCLLPHQPDHGPAAVGTDNPDQRIAEDVRDFVDHTLVLGISLLANIVTLVSFLGILWSLSGTITLFGIAIPGYMVWVAIVYAIIGTWLTHLIGKPLAALRFRQQRVEAEFRYSLVRFRENVEGVALYGGEAEEKGAFEHRLTSLIGNWWAIMRRTKLVESWSPATNRTRRSSRSSWRRRGISPGPSAGRPDTDCRRVRASAGRPVVAS